MQYHPKRVRNEILDQAEITRLLRNGNHATLALSSDDVPYIVTMSYGFDEPGSRLYFHCANKGDKLDYIRKNGKTCATIIEDRGYLKAKCDHDYASLVIRGTVSVVDGLEEKKHALQVLLNHLEEDPAPILERNIKGDASYDGVTILRLSMESVIGKKYIG